MSTLAKTKKASVAAAAKCASCTYWEAKAGTSGECRRHAPQTIAFTVDTDVKFESRFPLTKASDWCGDYSKA